MKIIYFVICIKNLFMIKYSHKVLYLIKISITKNLYKNVLVIIVKLGAILLTN